MERQPPEPRAQELSELQEALSVLRVWKAPRRLELPERSERVLRGAVLQAMP